MNFDSDAILMVAVKSLSTTFVFANSKVSLLAKGASLKVASVVVTPDGVLCGSSEIVSEVSFRARPSLGMMIDDISKSSELTYV